MGWRTDYAKGTVMHWDFVSALVVGGAAAGLGTIDDVRDAAIPVLIAEGAIGGALMATVFGALAIFATFFDGAYRRILDASGSFRDALMPYFTIAAVGGLAVIFGTVGALALPFLGDELAAAVLGLSTFFFAWCVTGMVSLTEITLFHASQRAKLMSGADDAEAIRVRRLKQRAG